MLEELFDSVQLGKLRLKNRLVRAATWEGVADPDGSPGAKIEKMYTAMAAGGIGMIIGSYTRVAEFDQPTPGMMGLFADGQLAGWQALATAVHRYDTPLCAQLVLGGAWQRPDGSSPGDNLSDAFTEADMAGICALFGQAALRAKAAGVDAVQIHAAHGYFLSRSLSPKYNTHTGEWGGSPARRSRLLVAVYQLLRQQLGSDYPILIKINCEDFEEGGATLDDSLSACVQLARLGLDGIEVSGGGRIWRTGVKTPSVFAEQAAVIAHHSGVPVMLTGNNRDPRQLTKLLQETEIGLFGLARPLLAEPDLASRWQRELVPAFCNSCGGCYLPEGTGCGRKKALAEQGKTS